MTSPPKLTAEMVAEMRYAAKETAGITDGDAFLLLDWIEAAAKLLRAVPSGFAGECGWNDEQEDEATALLAGFPPPQP